MSLSPLLFEESSECKELDDRGAGNVDINESISGSCDGSQESNTKLAENNNEEYKLVDYLREVLKGVPPPPGITVSQFDASEILHCLKSDNYENFKWSFCKGDATEREENKKLAESNKWPDVRNHFWYNVSYNRGFISEELGSLIKKYQERYIGNETSSSVNSFFSKSPIRTASAKKRARRHAWGHSPGRRLSHLARRRNTFSSANLMQNSSKLLVDKKKMILVNKRKQIGNSRKGGNSGKKLSKLAITKTLSSSSLDSSKRALFQSPENEKKNNCSNLSIFCDKRKSLLTEKTELKTKRVLWPKPHFDKDKENGSYCSINVNGKRSAETKFTDNTSIKKKCLRSLSFSEEQVEHNKIAPTLLPENLSLVHRQKLLWAVSDALRKEGIKTDNQHHKVFMSELFKISKEVWLRKCVKENSCGSTSDRMSQVACKLCPEVVKRVCGKLAINNVIDGKQYLMTSETTGMKTSEPSCNEVLANENFASENKILKSSELKPNILVDVVDNITYSYDKLNKDSAEEHCSTKENNGSMEENISNLKSEDDTKFISKSCNINDENTVREKVFRYTLIENVVNDKDCVNKKFKTELFIDGFKNVPLNDVKLLCSCSISCSCGIKDTII